MVYMAEEEDITTWPTNKLVLYLNRPPTPSLTGTLNKSLTHGH